RSFSVNGGSDLGGSSGALSLSGITSVAVDAAGGDDGISIVSTSHVDLPSFTIDGGIGDDEVTFNGSVHFANLDVDLQNDAPTPGTDRVTLAGGALVQSSGGAITIRCSRNVMVNASSTLQTGDGALVVEANQQASPTSGDFVGVSINGGLIEA